MTPAPKKTGLHNRTSKKMPPHKLTFKTIIGAKTIMGATTTLSSFALAAVGFASAVAADVTINGAVEWLYILINDDLDNKNRTVTFPARKTRPSRYPRFLIMALPLAPAWWWGMMPRCHLRSKGRLAPLNIPKGQKAPMPPRLMMLRLLVLPAGMVTRGLRFIHQDMTVTG